jgi:hypothetical protein
MASRDLSYVCASSDVPRNSETIIAAGPGHEQELRQRFIRRVGKILTLISDLLA